MTKRYISKQQQTRIRALQQARSQETEGQRGLLMSFHGKYAQIEAEDGKIFHCHLRQHLGALTAGDRITFIPGEGKQGVITALEPRHSVLGKVDKHGNLKPVAANLDQMIIVIAPTPLFTLLLLDSYLVAAELLHLQAIIVVNKIDLLTTHDQRTALYETLAAYQNLPYPLLYLSATQPSTLETLSKHLQHHTSVFVGQSGVGKSSLINHFIPEEELRIGELTATASGKHTTTSSRLYHLPIGGNLIDSPGVREFALWPLPSHTLARGFIEFKAHHCRFRDCSHHLEPGCAIQQAVKTGTIAPSRLDSLYYLQNK